MTVSHEYVRMEVNNLKKLNDKVDDLRCVLSQFVIHERSQALCVRGHPYMSPETKASLETPKQQQRYAKALKDLGWFPDNDVFQVAKQVKETRDCEACANRQRVVDKAYEALGTKDMGKFC